MMPMGTALAMKSFIVFFRNSYESGGQDIMVPEPQMLFLECDFNDEYYGQVSNYKFFITLNSHALAGVVQGSIWAADWIQNYGHLMTPSNFVMAIMWFVDMMGPLNENTYQDISAGAGKYAPSSYRLCHFGEYIDYLVFGVAPAECQYYELSECAYNFRCRLHGGYCRINSHATAISSSLRNAEKDVESIMGYGYSEIHDGNQPYYDIETAAMASLMTEVTYGGYDAGLWLSNVLFEQNPREAEVQRLENERGELVSVWYDDEIVSCLNSNSDLVAPDDMWESDAMGCGEILYMCLPGSPGLDKNWCYGKKGENSAMAELLDYCMEMSKSVAGVDNAAEELCMEEGVVLCIEYEFKYLALWLPEAYQFMSCFQQDGVDIFTAIKDLSNQPDFDPSWDVSPTFGSGFIQF